MTNELTTLRVLALAKNLTVRENKHATDKFKFTIQSDALDSKFTGRNLMTADFEICEVLLRCLLAKPTEVNPQPDAVADLVGSMSFDQQSEFLNSYFGAMSHRALHKISEKVNAVAVERVELLAELNDESIDGPKGGE